MNRNLRFLTSWFCLAAVLAALVSPGTAGHASAGATAATLRIAYVSDTHWKGGGANTSTRQVLAQIAKEGPQLLVHGGDITEVGATREYSEYLVAQATALPGLSSHYVPGNHDARWLDAGKAVFRNKLGSSQTYRSFTQGGVHVVLLDSTIDTETHGHFDPVQLDWLRRDLAALDPVTPVLVFFHHPVAYTPAVYMDTEAELIAALQPHNVRGVFTGHGHLHMRWERNGIPFYMVQAAGEGGYQVIDIGDGRIRVSYGALGQPLQQVTDLPLARPEPAGSVTVQNVEHLAPGQWRITARATGLPPEAKLWYRIDSGQWTELSPAPAGMYYATAAASGLAPGIHRLNLWAAPVGAQYPGKPLTREQWDTRNVGPSWTATRDFTVAPAGGGSPALAWQYRAAGGIQAAPAVGPDLVYAAARDGSLAALDPATGTVRWQYRLPGPVVGSPALSSDRVAVADTLGNVAVLDAAGGRELWTHRQGAPVLAEPLWAAGLLVFGDAKGTVTALDRMTGVVSWQQPVAQAAIRARLTFANGSLYVGAWDRQVYALDAFTGKVRWKQQLPGDVYYSPANQSPLYYRGRLFVTRSQPSNDAGLYALDARDGRVLWKAAGGFGYSAPVLHGGLVVAATGGGAVSGFDPLTGQKQWTAWTGMETFDGAVSSYGGDLVLSGLNGLVAAVRPEAGKATTVWKYSLGDGYLYARPAAGSGYLYVGSMDGSLYALRAAAPAAAALTAGSPGVPVALPIAASFPDARSHPAGGTIGLAQAMGLAGGYPDGTFRPEAGLTRAELATLQARFLGLTAPGKTFVTRFADLQKHWAMAAVAALEEQSLVQGEKGPDGKLRFNPDRAVTRAEAVQVTARLIARLQPSPQFRSSLADVAGHWSGGAVQAAEEAGLLAGAMATAGGFLPDRPITRAEATSLLVRSALGR